MKMIQFRRLTIWTIIFDFFIIVGAGHGLLCIGILELMSVIAFFTGHNFSTEFFSFSLFGSYEQSLGAVALFSFLGQILLAFSLFKYRPNDFWIKLVGLFFLWSGFYYLVHNLGDDDLSQVGFITGIPFLILSGLLAYKIIKEKMSLGG